MSGGRTAGRGGGSLTDLSPVVPAGRRLSPQTPVSLYSPGHGWAFQTPGVGSQADDPTDAPLGGGSLVLTTNGAGGVTSSRKSGLALNLTGKHLAVRVKVSDYAQISDLTLYVSSDSMATSAFARIVPSTVPQTPWLTNDEWMTCVLSQGDFSGSVNWGAVNALQWRVKDRGTGPLTARFGGIHAVDKPAQGVVSLTFDDNWLSAYTAARPHMDRHGYPGTMYVIQGTVGQPDYMTLAQLQALQNVNGWEIASHAYTLANHNLRFTNMTPAQMDAEFIALKAWMQRQGFRGRDHMAYPGGQYNATVLEAMRRHFASARTIYSPNPRESLTMTPHLYRLRAWSLTNADTLASVQAAVTKAAANGEWLILVFHRVVAAPSLSTEWATADFGALMDHIAASGVAVRTVGDVLRAA